MTFSWCARAIMSRLRERRRASMRRERVLKIILVVVGLFFSAAILPLVGGLRDPTHSDTGDTMMMSLYFALGNFLLIAVRNPSAHRQERTAAARSRDLTRKV